MTSAIGGLEVTYVIYLDILLVGNLVMNYAILWITAKITRFDTGWWRLLLGATVGSIYALTVFIPQLQGMLMWACKLVLSILMVLATFTPLPWGRFFIGLGWFYISSFAIGGVVMGTMYFMQSTGYYGQLVGLTELIQNYFWNGIVSALLITWLVGYWGVVVWHKRMYQKKIKVPVVIKMGNQQVIVDALLDTGNSLNDPVTGFPVTVVEYSAVQGLLPECMQLFYEKNEEADYLQLEKIAKESHWISRISMVPYRSLGKKNGMMLGFKPDVLEIHFKERIVDTTKVIIAIHGGVLAVDSGYRALLHPQLVKTA